MADKTKRVEAFKEYVRMVNSMMPVPDDFGWNPTAWAAEKAVAYPVVRHEDRGKTFNKLCYNNSLEEMPGWDYVEGYTDIENLAFPIHHAWNVTPDGEAVDVTLSDPETRAYWGVKLPMFMMVAAMTHDAWPHCYGVVNTVMNMNRDEREAIRIVMEKEGLL